jgi:hypothetical protein
MSHPNRQKQEIPHKQNSQKQINTDIQSINTDKIVKNKIVNNTP